MPRQKNWKWAEKKRTEWRERSRTAGGDVDTTDRERSRTDDGERIVKCDRPHVGGCASPSNVVAGHKCKIQAKNLTQIQAKNLAQKQIQAKNLAQIQAKNLAQNQSNTGKHTNFSRFKQVVNELSTLIKNVSSNIQTDFETEFLNVFPDVDGDQSSGINESSERENIVFSLRNTMPQQQTQLNKTVIAQQQKFNLDSLDTCSDNDDVVCYQAVRISEQLWNASNLLFGSFHQNDVRFSERSRGYQCTCNALCMLSYATCMDTEKSFILDKVLCEGDTLYKSVIEKLKSEGKFIHCLLNLEEIPDDFNIEIGKFMTEKLPIKSGLLVDTEGLGSPTLHEILQEAFLSVSSGLLTIGSICSAVFMKNGMYVFFDSHSHGKNGLTSSDGASCLITFSSFDDLVRYMYAFYDSLKLDSNIQFDFLPLKVHKTENTQSMIK